jgi:hypothetical protein
MNHNITQSTAERLHYKLGLGLFINNHATAPRLWVNGQGIFSTIMESLRDRAAVHCKKIRANPPNPCHPRSIAFYLLPFTLHPFALHLSPVLFRQDEETIGIDTTEDLAKAVLKISTESLLV